MTNIQEAEVEWYLRNGKHEAKRIARDSDGRRYVIGDQSWNSRSGNPREFIEQRMNADIVEGASQ